MLLKITEVCTMGCTHCGEECLSSGRDMSIETFLDTLEFIRKHLNYMNNIFIFCI